MAHNQILDSGDPSLYDVRSTAPGPAGALPVTPEMLLTRPSGDLFGWSQNAGMGWDPRALGGKEILILSTHGGIRDGAGAPIALGFHTGHWEVGLMMEAAARELKALGAIPFAAYCTDPCDGRTQGTTGMFDSLPYRNDDAFQPWACPHCSPHHQTATHASLERTPAANSCARNTPRRPRFSALTAKVTGHELFINLIRL